MTSWLTVPPRSDQPSRFYIVSVSVNTPTDPERLFYSPALLSSSWYEGSISSSVKVWEWIKTFQQLPAPVQKNCYRMKSFPRIIEVKRFGQPMPHPFDEKHFAGKATSTALGRCTIYGTLRLAAAILDWLKRSVFFWVLRRGWVCFEQTRIVNEI